MGSVVYLSDIKHAMHYSHRILTHESCGVFVWEYCFSDLKCNIQENCGMPFISSDIHWYPYIF